MYTAIRSFPAGLRAYLEQWEQDHNIPVRVIDGGWAVGMEQPNNNWTDRQVRESGFTRQQASAQGLTIVSNASHVNNAWIDYGRNIPIPPATDRARPDGHTFSDIITAYPPGTDDPTGRGPYDFGDYEPIVWNDPTNEQPRVYGEVGERVVFYYWHLSRCLDGYWDHNVLFAQLEDAIDSEAAERRMAELRERSFDHFMEFMSEGRINRQVDALRTQLQSHEANISQWQNSLAQAISQATGIGAQLQSLVASTGRSQEEWREQYNLIVNNQAVTDVIFRNNTLTVTTDHIRLQGQPRGSYGRNYEGQSRWLGRFQITVNLTDFSTRIQNLDNPQQGRAHPHVNGTSPCFGGNASEFTNLLGNGQFGIYFELIIAWLENYNPNDDWGRYADYWFNLPDADPRFQEDAQTEAPVEGGTEGATTPTEATVA